MFRGILLTSSSTRSAVLLWSEWAQKFIRARSCVNLVHLKKMSSKQETTFMYQEHLPSLPVQTLEHTCGKYLESVKHLLTDEEYMQTEFVVNEFQSGIGKKLQQKLEKRGKEHRNWLSQWWEEEAYLRPRSPVAPLVNIGGPFMMQEDVWPPAEGTLLKRAAFVIFALLDTWQKIYRQQLKIGKMGNKPLCMSQYLRLFSECRIPGKDLDSLKAHFCLAPEKPPRHIMVQTNGRIFTCYVLDENYEPLTPPDIERQLEAVVKMAKSRPLGPCIGALTAEDRTTWYQSRNLLIALDGKNGEYLHAIETAMVNLVLDYECEGKDYQEVTHNSILGDCRNRWFDKSITVIGCKMGTFATNCDHSPFDGIVEISTMIDASVMIRKFNGEWQGRQHIGNVTPPSELDFVVDDQMLKCVKTAVDKYQKEADRIIIIDTKTTMFGKNHIKRLGVHPDTFCQLAIQLTYYRMHNKPGTAYETAQTRQFYHGRTDTVRSCFRVARVSGSLVFQVRLCFRFARVSGPLVFQVRPCFRFARVSGSPVFQVRSCFRFACVSGSLVFQVRSCFRFARVSGSPVFQVRSCFRFARVSGSPVFQVRPCFRFARVSGSLVFQVRSCFRFTCVSGSLVYR
ncbi:peroxisomal carnitine O-octanoyltransferase isoform X3 [Nematostella vectensis]|uniref:peroxisomal carnitine O-octanoyltransferase isoform X3 n=1 Tax=Nematostella vectensis TaxID=45351 RepID=UPI002076DE29|nr:peroxisomal carnitine O-octanoyltransferase isoform X3 [Nematostella vectensis]